MATKTVAALRAYSCKGTDIRTKGTDDRAKGTDNRTIGLRVRIFALRVRITGLSVRIIGLRVRMTAPVAVAVAAESRAAEPAEDDVGAARVEGDGVARKARREHREEPERNGR